MRDLGPYAEKLKKESDVAYRQRLRGRYRLLHGLAVSGRPMTRRWKALKAVRAMTRKYGKIVADQSGTPMWRQVLDQYLAAVRFSTAPAEYYEFALYRDPALVEQYIPADVWWRLLDDLLAKHGTREGELLDDKGRSNHHFLKHGLPVVPTLAEFENGRITTGLWKPGTPLPQIDLFSKPVDAARGIGAQRWRVHSNGIYRTEEGNLVDQDELIRRVREQSRKRVMLLQRRVDNHPSLREMTGDTLASLRIFTMRAPGQRAEYVTGIVSLPLGDVIGSNERFGVVWAPIETVSGTLGAASVRDPARVMEPIRSHPETGRPIEGFRLPDWEKIIDLALRGHDSLPEIAIIGWDLASTVNGPVIIEGNCRPGGAAAQIAHKTPWGATRFRQLWHANVHHSPPRTQPRQPSAGRLGAVGSLNGV